MSGPRRPAIEAPEIHFDAEHPHEEFFAPWREARALRYGSPSAPPRNRLPWRRSRRRRAVVTIVHDEAVFLPLWLGYYSRYFAADDIYVLDNDSSDGSTDRDGFVRVPTPHPSVDHTWMAETLAAFQEELLDRYDVVVVADADEIISPLPSWGTLDQYIDRLDEEFVNPLGYEILHLPDREPPLDLSRPVLDQRGYWFANDAYDKPLLATVPMTWVPGSTRAPTGAATTIPTCASSTCTAWTTNSAAPATEPAPAAIGRAATSTTAGPPYNRLEAGEEFDRWFLNDSGFESEGIHIVLRADSSRLAGPRVNPLRRLAGGVARRADRLAFPPAAGAPEHWQRVVMNEAVESPDRVARSAADCRGRDQRRPARRQAMARVRKPGLARVRHLRSAHRRAQVRPGDLRAGSRARRRPVGRGANICAISACPAGTRSSRRRS